MNLLLVREPSGYGVLTVGRLTLQTIERPWLDNRKGVSCVPIGRYRLERHDTEGHPRTWALVAPELNVFHWPQAAPEARSACLIHAANLAAELRGCIAPGMMRGELEGQPAVLQSRLAMSQLRVAVPWTDEHTLEISNAGLP